MCDKATVQRLPALLSFSNFRRRADLREGLDYELSGRLYRCFWVGARADAEALPLPALLQAPAGVVNDDDDGDDASDDDDDTDFDRDEARFSLDLAALEAGDTGADDRFNFCGDPPEHDNYAPDYRWIEQWDATTGTGWVEFEQEFDGDTSLHSWSVDLVPLG